MHIKNIECTKLLIEKGLTITTMESCTSGLIASMITDTEGASAIMKGAFVTYSNEAKIANGVPKRTIDAYGVYSRETALEMAKACKQFYKADIGIGITGTTGNLDPNNNDSKQGIIHLVIIAPTVGRKFINTYAYIIEVDTEGKSRNEIKLEIAENVFNRLYQLLENFT